jgi:hypothetical protein
MTQAQLRHLRRLAAAATPGPWRSTREGNQYVNAGHMGRPDLVEASKIEALKRPWNPYKYVIDGAGASEFETVRFRDADADYIAALSPDVVFQLIGALERLAGYKRYACLKCGCMDFDYELGEHPGVCYCCHTDLDHKHEP